MVKSSDKKEGEPILPPRVELWMRTCLLKEVERKVKTNSSSPAQKKHVLKVGKDGMRVVEDEDDFGMNDDDEVGDVYETVL